MGKKTARFSVQRAELGWAGTKGGRTIVFRFRDDGKLIGTLQISEAAIKWKRAGLHEWKYDIPVDKLNNLFKAGKALSKS